MLKWMRTQAGIVREAVRYGHPIGEVRKRRIEEAANLRKEAASIRTEAETLGASIEDIRKARSKADGVIAIDTKFGRMHLRPKDTDLLVIRQIFIDKEYDIDALSQMATIRARYDAMLAAGEVPVVVDAGANIGAASMWFAARFPDARVIAVEPDPKNAAVARMNVEALPNASLREAAIGAQAGRVELQSFVDQGWGGRTARSDSSEGGIAIVTIPELVGSVPGGRLLIAKVDIEGFESDLFAENTGWIDEAAAIFIEPHDWMLPGEGSSQSFQKALLGRGRELLIVGENLVFV